MCTCEGHCDGTGGLHYRFGEFSVAERCCRCLHVAPAEPSSQPERERESPQERISEARLTPEPMATQGESERKTAYTLGLESMVKHYEKRIAELEQRIAAANQIIHELRCTFDHHPINSHCNACGWSYGTEQTRTTP